MCGYITIVQYISCSDFELHDALDFARALQDGGDRNEIWTAYDHVGKRIILHCYAENRDSATQIISAGEERIPECLEFKRQLMRVNLN